MKRKAWTVAEDKALSSLYAELSATECAAELGRTVSSIQQRVSLLGLSKSAKWIAKRARQRWAEGRHEGSRKGHFAKGAEPFNKGVPMASWNPNSDACKATQFRKGQVSGRARELLKPIGTLRVVKGGTLERKVSNDGPYPAARWRSVHRLVWEAAHGPMPRGHLVVFKPGMATAVESEITLDRLELVSRAENMRRNSYHTRYPELAGLIQLRGALNRKINNRSK